MASSNTIARLAVRSGVWTTLGNYVNQTIGFVSLLILTRMLPPETFGIFSIATFFLSLTSIRTKTGLSFAAIQSSRTDGKLFGTFYALDIGSALLSVLVASTVAAVLWQWDIYSKAVIGAMLVLIGIESLASIISPFIVALEKELQLSRVTLVQTIGTMVAYPLAIALAWNGAGLWSLVSINVTTYVVTSIGFYYICRQRQPWIFQQKWEFDRELARDLLSKGLVTGLSLALLTLVVQQYDNFLIGTFVNETVLGFYDRAYRIASWPNLILTLVVTRVGFLTMAKVKDDPQRLTHTVRLSLWVILTLGLPMMLALAFGASDVVHILYGTKYAQSAGFLSFLAITNFLWTIVSLGFWLATSLGNTRTGFLFSIVQASLLVILGTPLTMWLGTVGTLSAVLVAMFVAVVLNGQYIFRRVSINFKEFIFPYALATLTSSLLLFWLTQYGLPALTNVFFHFAIIASATTISFMTIIISVRFEENKAILLYLRNTWSSR